MFQRYSFEELLKTIKKDLKPQHSLVFDCDGTLIDGDVSSLTGWQLMKDGLVDMHLVPHAFQSPSFYMRMNMLDYDKVRKEVEKNHGIFYALEWELYIQSGIPHTTVVQYAHKALDYGFQKSLLSFTETLPLILKEFTAQSWIVSGSSYPTVLALAEKLGVSGERVLATRLEQTDGIYQQSFAPPGFVWEHNKVVALKGAGIESPYLVAGDSPGDWHMMQLSTHWVWCMLWRQAPESSRNYRKFLEEKLPFGQEIPLEAGFYVTEWQRKHWVFQVMD